MAFKIAFIVRAPEADPNENISPLKAKAIDVTTVAVELNNSNQMIKTCANLVKNNGIQALVLCPAVSNELVSKISDVVDEAVAVFVARGDFNSANIAQDTIEKEWFS